MAAEPVTRRKKSTIAPVISYKRHFDATASPADSASPWNWSRNTWISQHPNK
eukprot:CAMPEP_0117074784 /NCGR_PEP_ID=MMETSP0472-20121206/52706_1 /TAXON_ID=693140 ORGANISM="Tiarina fusus, Strain LIS" /NCGR_SAMPLE_ID=MMETSP0472 /ASSEMBLY_ACC=CAM_ASM_000603 /LENGTH=51 /DNA_ID=CAMNT_0004799983 /DNA_START=38 /DNA_END=190 /DNA_ORIENTATION=+